MRPGWRTACRAGAPLSSGAASSPYIAMHAVAANLVSHAYNFFAATAPAGDPCHLPRCGGAPAPAFRRDGQSRGCALEPRSDAGTPAGLRCRPDDSVGNHRCRDAGFLFPVAHVFQYGCGLQQPGFARTDGNWRAGHQHTERADRNHGRFRLCPAAGHCAPRDRGRALAARRPLDQMALRHTAGLRRAWQHPGHSGHGPYRSGHRTPGRAWLWHEGDLSQPQPARCRHRAGVPGALCVSRGLAARIRSSGAGVALFCCQPPCHRHGGAAPDETYRQPDQHRAWWHRGRCGARAGVA